MEANTQDQQAMTEQEMVAQMEALIVKMQEPCGEIAPYIVIGACMGIIVNATDQINDPGIQIRLAASFRMMAGQLEPPQEQPTVIHVANQDDLQKLKEKMG